MSYSVALDGISGRVVTVEADISDGIPGWSLSGLPDPVVADARDRCRAAMINSGGAWPDRRITVAMYPSDVRKVGSHYDLAIALALLAAKGSIPTSGLRSCAVFGGLALDGRVRTVPGVLPAVLAAFEAGLERVIVPEHNVAEARLVAGVEIVAVKSLRECMAILAGKEPPDEPNLPPLHGEVTIDAVRPLRIDNSDLLDVRGQIMARWCVEVAAAGGHHLFLEGPPGAGKTMLAERLPALLPDLSVSQSIEVSKIHSVAGLLSADQPLVTRPPFLAPNHTDTVPSVIGGGSRVIRPGAISLAHLGVLFMDEAPEFAPSVHDALRQPLESGEISIRRADGAAKFPAGFQLLLAANPCPCGFGYGHGDKCTCSASKKRLYQARLSGPIRDRIDIVHTVLPVSRAEMHQQVGADGSTAAVTGRVAEARRRQWRRFSDLPWVTNADLPGYEFRRRCPLDAGSASLVEDAVAAGSLTQRGADRVTRVAWTIADLDGSDRPDASHVVRALYLRSDSQLGKSPAARELVSWGA
ncbi:MAG: YifB family Mg chelatase-like AAA ATPase [Actinomycetota bacterium]|nr:YifB family Mg chelatase-like AAA ATPase [Actinomycetota bacterium]